MEPVNTRPGIVKPEYPESELTSRIIGCAMEVHSILGNGDAGR